MSLVDCLLNADVKKADELTVGKCMSKRLAKILGKEDAVEITLQEIEPKRLKDLQMKCLDKKGNIDLSKALEMNAYFLVDGIIDPPLKDETLRQHFQCATPVDLAIKLFGMEVDIISGKIMDLSGITDDAEEEIKN